MKEMDGLEMGQRVRVKALAEWSYVTTLDGNRRVWQRAPLEKSREGWYVGYTFKQEGVHVPPVYDGTDYEQASLKNIKSIKLMRVKFHDWGNDKFAFRQDVEEIPKEKGGDSGGR